MQWDFYKFMVFAVMMSITPGPNNTLLLAAGIHAGAKKALIPALGIMVGFGGIVMLSAYGVGLVITRYPILNTIMLYIGAGFLCYLAYKIATSTTVLEKGALQNRPIISFWQAIAIQLINPKGWTMGIMASSLFMPIGVPLWQGGLLLGLGFAAAYLPCGLLWIFGGVGLRKIMRSERQMQYVNYTLGAMLVLLAVWLIVSS